MAADGALLVLDTHAVVWWSLLPRHLGRRASRVIDEADQLGVPAIVFWEVSLLVRKGKLSLGRPVAEWASLLCSIPRVEPLPLTAAIALRADLLDMHPDPADRFIVATALEHGARLLTKDRLLRGLPFLETLW
jgi:PIN domain nuclease of toxin-antitoxin system